MTSLDLSENRIKLINDVYFHGLNSLSNLDLSRNDIKFLEKFSSFSSSNNVSLDLSYNRITSIDLISNFSHALQSVSLRCNPLHNLSFGSSLSRSLNLKFYFNCPAVQTEFAEIYFNVQNTISSNSQIFFFWFIDEVDIPSVQNNIELFYRKRFKLLSGRYMIYFESVPVRPRVSPASFEVEYFFGLYRELKILRLCLGDINAYEAFIAHQRHKDLPFINDVDQ